MKRSIDVTKWYLAAAFVLAALPLLLAACAEEKGTITFGHSEGSFGTVPMESEVAGFIIESVWGYPYEVSAMTTPAYQATLASGDLDALMEGWEQNNPEWYTSNIEKGTIENLGPMLEGGPQMWVIPQYVHDEFGIESVEDLADPEVAKLFVHPEESDVGAFYDCIIGWNCEKINKAKLRAYGLDKYYAPIAPGSGGALKAALASAQLKKEPVFGYYWSPTSLMGQFDWYILKEPTWTQECWDEVIKGSESDTYVPAQACAYSNLPLNKLVSSGLKDKAPEAYEFLKKMQMNLDRAETTMSWAEEQDIKEITDMRVVAHYIRTYTDNVKSWLSDDEWKKVDEALKDLDY
jgi:ABC-type proline/glycine betaine transport system substrate-binding protein